MKIRKGDEVKIVSGKDKGKVGKVEKALEKESKVLVTGVNLYKKHVKSRTQKQQSDIVTISKPLPLANVILICPNCRKETRVGYEIKDGEKFRVCKKCKKKI